MKTSTRLTALAAALSAVFSVNAFASVSGNVVGNGYYQGALVCIDANQNGRCDTGETSTTSDINGSFTFADPAAATSDIVAEISTSATLVKSGVSTPVARALKFRAASAANTVVGSISTELHALMDTNGGSFATARTNLAARVGVTEPQLLEDPNLEGNTTVQTALLTENDQLLNRIAEAVTEAGAKGNLVKSLSNRLALDKINNVVVIYLENRSFDNLYGMYPGVNGLKTVAAKAIKQVDRDGSTVLSVLPPAWNGLTASGQTPAVTQAQTTSVWPNAPFQIDASTDQFGYGVVSNTVVTRDLYHRFFENAMQINGGLSNMYAAWADSGGLVMGYFDGSKTQMWTLAKQYAVADNFFQAAYGGSFLNHQYLICACVPTVPAATVTANGMSKNTLTTSKTVNGQTVPQLAANASQQASALNGSTSFKTGNIAPLDYFGSGDGYRAVNTMQPAFQPSGNKPADNTGNDGLYANPAAATTLPAQTQATIGDLLTAKGVDWTWFSGGWSAASTTPYPFNSGTGTFGTSTTIYNANASGTSDSTHSDFQAHHQPFNYFAIMDPVNHAADRAAHLKDRSDLLSQASAGTLPAVSFYKPVGFMNQHPGYANVTDADNELATVLAALKASPQWNNMLVLITYDEFGGQFDHVAPPAGDLVGPGTRIPAVIVSPYAKKGFVDHTQYDTASVLRFVTHRYSLPVLPGLQLRDTAVTTSTGKPMGDLTNVLTF